MADRPPLTELENAAEFTARHVGNADPTDTAVLLDALGVTSAEALVAAVVPESIRMVEPLALPPGRTEADVMARLEELAGRNRVVTSLIGTGYTGTFTPAVIRRKVLENPAWYSSYTPYQPEISCHGDTRLLPLRCDIFQQPGHLRERGIGAGD